jgi:ribosomal 30S subunit maturation factor RimM
VAFSSNGPQDLLVVDYKGNKVDIPFVEAFISKIDFELQIVSMNLPPGLIEVSLK